MLAPLFQNGEKSSISRSDRSGLAVRDGVGRATGAGLVTSRFSRSILKTCAAVSL